MQNLIIQHSLPTVQQPIYIDILYQQALSKLQIGIQLVNNVRDLTIFICAIIIRVLTRLTELPHVLNGCGTVQITTQNRGNGPSRWRWPSRANRR